jgi:superfamily II DNA or RNA helicase
MVIDGTNSKQVRALLDKFKADPSINPLIASTKVLSTGHTIVECNTVIFLNVPFRSVDYYQASDRVYRIGQDADVYIYKLILDTGSKPNLSTRMQDILQWSKEQFTQLIGDDGNLMENMDDNVRDMMGGLDNPDESIFDRSKQLMLAPLPKF